jgi:hypothetical protein
MKIDPVMAMAMRAAAKMANEAAEKGLALVESIGDRTPTDEELKAFVGFKAGIQPIFSTWTQWKLANSTDEKEKARLIEPLIVGFSGNLMIVLKKRHDEKGTLESDDVLEALMESIGSLMNPFGHIVDDMKESAPDFDADLNKRFTAESCELMSDKDIMLRVCVLEGQDLSGMANMAEEVNKLCESGEADKILAGYEEYKGQKAAGEELDSIVDKIDELGAEIKDLESEALPIKQFQRDAKKVIDEIESGPGGKDSIVRVLASLDQMKSASPDAVKQAMALIDGLPDEALEASLDKFLSEDKEDDIAAKLGMTKGEVKGKLLALAQAIKGGDDVITPMLSEIIGEGEKHLSDIKDEERN